MSFVVQVRQRARSNVSAVMVVWAIVMTVVLAVWEISPRRDGESVLWGFVATAVFGLYLGWRRHAAAVFVAPFVSWSIAWLPLWISAMVRHGFLKGLFVGLFLVTVGWLVIGTIEFVSLGAVTLLARSLRGPRSRPHPGDDDVIIFGPNDVL
jgi:hypothetical protein